MQGYSSNLSMDYKLRLNHSDFSIQHGSIIISIVKALIDWQTNVPYSRIPTYNITWREQSYVWITNILNNLYFWQLLRSNYKFFFLNYKQGLLICGGRVVLITDKKAYGGGTFLADTSTTITILGKLVNLMEE